MFSALGTQADCGKAVRRYEWGLAWLMGMKMSFTKKPRNPTAKKPTAVSRATLVNSLVSGFWQRFKSLRAINQTFLWGVLRHIQASIDP